MARIILPAPLVIVTALQIEGCVFRAADGAPLQCLVDLRLAPLARIRGSAFITEYDYPAVLAVNSDQVQMCLFTSDEDHALSFVMGR